jgi:hypothetical protein
MRQQLPTTDAATLIKSKHHVAGRLDLGRLDDELPAENRGFLAMRVVNS